MKGWLVSVKHRRPCGNLGSKHSFWIMFSRDRVSSEGNLQELVVLSSHDLGHRIKLRLSAHGMPESIDYGSISGYKQGWRRSEAAQSGILGHEGSLRAYWRIWLPTHREWTLLLPTVHCLCSSPSNYLSRSFSTTFRALPLQLMTISWQRIHVPSQPSILGSDALI